MKLRKQLFKALLCVLILAQLVPCLALGIGASDTATVEDTTPDGLSFSESGKYVQQKPLWGVPEDIETVVTGAGTSYEATKTLDNGVLSGAITFETMIYIPSTMEKNSITLFSNLWATEEDAAGETYLNTLSLEISYTSRKGGGFYPCIRLSSVGEEAGSISYRMTTGSKIPTDTWTHIALTLDTSKPVTYGEKAGYDFKIYYNAAQKVSSSNMTVDGVSEGCAFGEDNGLYNADNYILGGTYDQARDGHFGGYLQSFSVFNEARSAAQIAEDCAKGFNLTDEGRSANTFDAREMLCYYEFSRESVGRAAISDLSPMGNDLLLIGGTEGIPFTQKDFLVMDKNLSDLPLTLEARVSVPSKGKFYPILYGFDQYGNNLCWGIQGRRVKLYYSYRLDGKSKEAALLFENSINHLPSGAWVDIAVTVDFANQQYKCYVDGELVETLTPTGDEAALFTEAAAQDYLGATFVVGSNCAWGNTANYYQGRISEIALYSDIRGEEEIRIDHQYGYSTKDEALIAEYDLTTLVGAENVIDKTGNGHHLRSDTWMTEEEADLPTDYAYSFAVVGDTQFLSRYNVSGFEDNLNNLYKWILDNQERFKTKHVFGVGDIVESGADAANNKDGINEWAKAYAAISQMDGKISYSLVRGNTHDDVTLMTQYMGTPQYYAMFESSEEYGFYQKDRMDIAYRTFTVGQTKYLFLMLDYGIYGDQMQWAENLIASHPNHKVIITTHKYLNTDGTLEATGEAGLEVFGKYDNVELILCGHEGGEDIVYRQDTSPEGNLITSMMVNSQNMDKYCATYGGFGMVAMLYFSEDGRNVTVRYYSTVLDRYFRPDNQFTLTLGEEKEEAEEDLKITGASVDLGATLAVNYYVSVLNEHILEEGALTMRFTVNEKTVVVSDYRVIDGEYVFTLSGLAPQQMSDAIDASLFVGDAECLTHSGYSIKKNFQNLLSESASELGMSKEKHAAMVTLISDLLVYGAAAQQYKDYNTDALVTSGVEGLTPSSSAPTDADQMKLTDNVDPTLHFSTATIHFDTANKIHIEIYANVADTSLVGVRINGADHTAADLTALGNDTYLVTTDELCATQFADALSIELSYEGTVVSTISYSINAYAYEMNNGGTQNAEMQALALALYRYGQSAVAYTTAK